MSGASRIGRALALAAVLWLGGCAAPQTTRLLDQPGELAPSAEVAGVPFHPQEELFCGPASLATVLGWSGLAITQQALAAQVFTPGREGSLQNDMLAAARRHGRLAVPVAGLANLLAEVAAGHPVLVLQNLALDWHPAWHYAVAVGYDLAAGEVILRSGTVPRHRTRLSTFEHTWRRGGHWAVVVLPPDRLPARADEATLLEAASGLERAGRPHAAARAYGAIATRWPTNFPALLGRGNALYAAGDLAGAEVALRDALLRFPKAADAWNNLAQVLHERGRRAPAMAAAREAVRLGGPRLDIYRRTLDEISATAI